MIRRRFVQLLAALPFVAPRLTPRPAPFQADLDPKRPTYTAELVVHDGQMESLLELMLKRPSRAIWQAHPSAPRDVGMLILRNE